MGGGARIDHAARKEQLKDDEALAESSGLPVFVMEAGKLSVLETVGMAKLIVLRIGNTDSPAAVDFETKDCTAKAGSHYEHNSGTIEFAKGETQRDIFIKIIHDEKFNDDLSFSLNLSVKDASTAKLGRQNSCQLTIIDMDGPGIFVWQDDVKHQYKSTDSKVPLLIERNKGATGDSCVRVVTVDGTAQAGTHFEKLEEEILFKNNVAVKTVKIDLQKFDKPEGSPEDYKVSFFVDLQDVPEKAGGATLGDITRVEVEITHSGDDEVFSVPSLPACFCKGTRCMPHSLCFHAARPGVSLFRPHTSASFSDFCGLTHVPVIK
ncbi:MAG: Calx-beta domain-containing protein [Promethearchaeia archaeon]